MFQGDGSSSSSVSTPALLLPWTLSPVIGSPYPFLRELKSEDRGLCLIHLLLYCASHVATGHMEYANIGLEHISQLASPDGDAIQRIASYFSEALADRVLKAWPGLHKALNSTKISSVSDQIFVQRLFFEICPFFKLANLITNQTILEAMKEEKMIHIIDFNSCEPTQWINLLQTLKERPEGPPHVRITGIHEQKEVLEQMAIRLNEEAEKLDIPFQFISIASRLENLDFDSLRVKTGEALAVSSVLELHSLLASDEEGRSSPLISTNIQKILHVKQRTLGEWFETDSMTFFTSPESGSTSSTMSLSPSQKMGSFLNALRGLSPKITVITEQESNLNGCTLIERVRKALDFYASLFDCLESTVSRSSPERHKVEKMLFGEQIKNIIACEGGERKERYEKLEKWILRLEVAGFGRVPLSYHGKLLARKLLQNHGYDGYKIKEENGCLFICWHNQPLCSVSAWGLWRNE